MLVENFSICVVPDSSTMKSVIENLTSSGRRLSLVVDQDYFLTGIVTDGDIRRSLLAGENLESPAHEFMNTNFASALEGTPLEKLKRLARSREVGHVPLVNLDGKLVGLYIDEPHSTVSVRDNTVVVMAGGKGLRLRPLTEGTPKPMLHVGGKPMVQHTIESLRSEGFANFVLAINYLGDQIEDYFGNGSEFGVRVSYLKETEPLGTGGALSLLDGDFRSPVILVNGDVLISARISEMLDFHLSCSADITVGVKVLETPIPFGVIELEGDRIVRLQEKPVYRDFINAGVYVLEPAVVKSVEREKRLDMPDLVSQWLGRRHVVAYPLHEPWRDLGHLEDLESARKDFERQGN